MGEPGQGLQRYGGVEEQVRQVLLLVVGQLRVVNVVEPQDELKDGVIIRTSFNKLLLGKEGPVISFSCELNIRHILGRCCRTSG